MLKSAINGRVKFTSLHGNALLDREWFTTIKGDATNSVDGHRLGWNPQHERTSSDDEHGSVHFLSGPVGVPDDTMLACGGVAVCYAKC